MSKELKVRTVLILEDSDLSRIAMVELLGGYGWDVHGVSTVHAAMVLAKTLPRIDAVVSDVVCPGGEWGGIAFVRALRLDPGTASIPVILRTALSDTDLKTALDQDEMGLIYVLRKPSDVQDLDCLLRGLIGNPARPA